MTKNVKNSKNNYYTFMFFPEGKGEPFTLRIHRYAIRLTVISLIVIFAGLIIMLAKSAETALKLQMVHDLKQENQRLREHSRDLEISSQKIASIDSLAVYLHRLASVTDLGAVTAPRRITVPDPSIAVALLGASTADRSSPGVQPPPVQTEAVARPAAEGPGPEERVAASRSTATTAVGVVEYGEYIESMPNILPVDGWITKHFAPNAANPHYGVDIAAAAGTPIRVTAMGVVEDVRKDRYFGRLVEVRHDNGFVTRYAHCLQVLVLPGDRVSRGQAIALVGNTGRSTAPHLHYEVMKYGKYVDPMTFIGTHEQ